MCLIINKIYIGVINFYLKYVYQKVYGIFFLSSVWTILEQQTRDYSLIIVFEKKLCTKLYFFEIYIKCDIKWIICLQVSDFNSVICY